MIDERETFWWIVQIAGLESHGAMFDVGTASIDFQQDVRAPVAVVRELDKPRAREGIADRIGQAGAKLIKDCGLSCERPASFSTDLSSVLARSSNGSRSGTRV